MSEKQDQNLHAGLAPALQPGEQVVTYLFASTRGYQQAIGGGIAGAVGGRRSGGALREAAEAGITLSSPMALVLTGSRLITVQVGNAGKVKQVLDEFDLAEVGAMSVKRLGLGASVTLEIRGVDVRLESRVGASRAFAEQLAATKAAG